MLTTPPTEPTRRVFIYPVEYRSYGPDGVNVVYERENYGANAGQWVKRYLTTDYQGTVLQAHDVTGDHVQHYELFGAEKGQVARRTGWLDREIDWESSPLTDLYRTVDLVNRKYDPQRGVFLTSDPLWMMSADASSYHYAYHDPMNMIDPWGLDGQTDGGVGGSQPSGTGPIPGVGTSKPSTKEITPFDHSFSFWMDGARGDYLHGIGEGALPGMSIGGGGLGPLGGSNGGTGKTDVAPGSSPTGTGNETPAATGKFAQLYIGGGLDNVADRGLEGANPKRVVEPAKSNNEATSLVPAISLAGAYVAELLASVGTGFGVGSLMLLAGVAIPGDTPLEARRHDDDPHYDEHNDGARKKPGNNGKMGKNGPQNKQWSDALNSALRSELVRRTLSDDERTKMHDALHGLTNDYKELVMLMREWLRSKGISNAR